MSEKRPAAGLKKHLKRLNDSNSSMDVDKAPKVLPRPHKSGAGLPLIQIFLCSLKHEYEHEVPCPLASRKLESIMNRGLVLVNGKFRTDNTNTGFMDVVSIPKTNEHFRIMWFPRGRRLRLHTIGYDETMFKLCKVRNIRVDDASGIPYINTYDGRKIRCPDPLIEVNDTIKLDLESNKIAEFVKLDIGNVVMVAGGRGKNRGRVGVIKKREKRERTINYETIYIKDATGLEFEAHLANVFTIGKGAKPWLSLLEGKSIKLSFMEEVKKTQAELSSALKNLWF